MSTSAAAGAAVLCGGVLGQAARDVHLCADDPGDAPCPAFTEPAAVEDLVLWARKLVGSPRVRESDAGTPHLYHCSALYGRPLPYKQRQSL